MVVFLTSIFWWAGMISLWIAAQSRHAIGKPTAVGLVLGIIGAVLYVVLGLTKGRPPVELKLLWSILLIGPVCISLVHLSRFRKLMRTDPSARPIHTPRPPPSEASTRRVGLTLKVLLFGQVLTFCLAGATLLSGSAGLGGLMMMVLAFPVALGVASFSVWAFVRHRSQRPWAAVVFFAPFVLSKLLQLGVKHFGEPAMTAGCERAVPWLPVVAILLFPQTVGGLIPRPLRGRTACITYVVIQGVMVLLWGLLLLGLRISFDEASAGSMPFALLFTSLFIPVGGTYAALSVLAGVTGLVFSYVGLFRQREERFIGLSIAHMVLSIPLLTFGVYALQVLMVFMTPIG
jgi:hypothetical protein